MRYLWVALLLVMCPLASFGGGFQVTSVSVKEQGAIGNEHVFNGFGCSGQNISPELRWEHAPKETKSYAVTVYDPDAPTGSGWWHWVLFNIPADVTSPPARRRQGRRYRGACGEHPEHDRFRTTGVWRPLPAAGRQTPSVYLHGVRVEGGPVAPQAGSLRCDGGIFPQSERTGEGLAYGDLWPLSTSTRDDLVAISS